MQGEKGRVGRITVRLTLSQWDSSNQLYFTVTSYKLGKAGHTRQECSELRSAGKYVTLITEGFVSTSLLQ